MSSETTIGLHTSAGPEEAVDKVTCRLCVLIDLHTIYVLTLYVSQILLVVVDNSQNTPAQPATPPTVHSPVSDQR